MSPRQFGRPEQESDLTAVEISLNRVRLIVFRALELGASRQDIEREAAEAARILARIRGRA